MDESAGRSKANKRSLWGEIEQQDVNHGQPPQQRFKPPSARLRFTALNSDPTPLNMTTGAQPGSGISRGLSGALSWDYNRRNGGPVSASAAATIARASGGVTAPSTVGVDAIQLEEQIHNQASGRNHFHPILSSVPSATGWWLRTMMRSRRTTMISWVVWHPYSSHPQADAVMPGEWGPNADSHVTTRNSSRLR